ncbi:MAG: NADPH-dependent F420 reductase [Acholeplasmataceae bacterium]|nr:NADPH-dependent F420 reductase [Acholeplasmataceae bacterium]
MKIAFIGIGNVGFAIANNLQKIGHQIIVATNNKNSDSVKNASQRNPEFEIKPVQDAVNECDIVFLATPFQANQTVLSGIKFNGKPLVDCTNPIGMGTKGLKHGLDSEKSGSEVVQELAQDAKVVKAFSVYGYENFIDSSFPKYNVKPAMLICGNDKDAKAKVSFLLEELGFTATDTGNLTQALHLEHMTLLWVKMVRVNGHHPNFVWAYLEK